MLVAFDVDGVLVEVSESYHQALPETISLFLKSEVDSGLVLALKHRLALNNDWDATLAGILYYRSRKQVEDFILMAQSGPPDYRKIYRLAAEMKIELPDYKQVISEFESIYRKHREKEKLHLPVEFLEKVRERARVMAVITGRTREDLDHTFKRYSLDKYFDYVITEDDLPGVEFRKPSSYPLKRLLKSSGYFGPACYVGDTLIDRQMVENYCREENKPMAFVLYRHQYNAQVEAELAAGNPAELLEVICRLE
ncbi:MAG: HAD family hydrolase [Candidatus Saccharicenans sp.]|nr:MAG: histidinol-phosphatase [Candidatus Aminicenantes bacterium]HEK85182.1 HAD family hydrolase [Candidatus Aminicenantes bacterium]